MCKIAFSLRAKNSFLQGTVNLAFAEFKLEKFRLKFSRFKRNVAHAQFVTLSPLKVYNTISVVHVHQPYFIKKVYCLRRGASLIVFPKATT